MKETTTFTQEFYDELHKYIGKLFNETLAKHEVERVKKGLNPSMIVTQDFIFQWQKEHPEGENKGLPVKRVDNGNVFGTGHWYTFYCPRCGNQLDEKGDCPNCKQKIDWTVESNSSNNSSSSSSP